MVLKTASGVVDISNEKIIETQLGPINQSEGIVLTFTHGLVGFENEKEFILAQMPQQSSAIKEIHEKNDISFLLMQSLQSPKLCFIVLPYEFPQDVQNKRLIQKSDVNFFLQKYELPEDSLGLFIIISFDSKLLKSEGYRITANMKAPIIVDLNSGNAWQVILPGDLPLNYELV